MAERIVAVVLRPNHNRHWCGIAWLRLGRLVGCILLGAILLSRVSGASAQEQPDELPVRLLFNPAPDLPDPIGIAGPIVGVIEDRMVVAGGANFSTADDPELWDLPKHYGDQVWVLRRSEDSGETRFSWAPVADDSRLSVPIAYPAIVETDHGILVMGGENESGMTDRAYFLNVTPATDSADSDTWTVSERDRIIPDLPLPCVGGGAAVVGDFVYLVAGRVEQADGSVGASRLVWRFDLTGVNPASPQDADQELGDWEEVANWPDEGPPRMFPLVTAQHDGFKDRLFVIGGRHFPPESDTTDAANLVFGCDGWSFDPSVSVDPGDNDRQPSSPWKRIADSPVPLTAGTAVAFGPAHVMVTGYASGDVLRQQLDSGVPMQDFEHPGFPQMAYAYHTLTDTWTEFGEMPANQVTTPAVRWGDEIWMVSGEVRPRVRTNKVWRITVPEIRKPFGAFNMTIVVLYLIGMVGVGVFFTFRNRSTDDYFRGGKSVPWWAAGCSIFATMLSSITYMAIPAKSFAQDWVYAFGSVMILLVAPIAVYVALPFFRRLDVTSAYEYLEQRFNRTARLVGSGSFTLFHVFRMGVVLALAALALASVTPLSPVQCVVVMGVLSIVYCTLGGIEAVIWTDTIQTFILLGGALVCLGFAVAGSNPGSLAAATDAGKFHLANFDFGPDSFMAMAFWVVVIGAFGQNVASYTADQAVVQRYMTTPDQRQAGRSIWLNGVMAIPSAVLFFGLGSAFWMFYRSHPEKLDATIAADRILPHFINQELPMGLAGLVVAGIFAAAQSTVSTSMNSGATTIVTDFVQPFFRIRSDRVRLWLARVVTLVMGILGTIAGLTFIDPTIRSLFDQFIAILGIFLGVLAGLFALGATTRRANGRGSLVGASVAIVFMVGVVFAKQGLSVGGVEIRGLFDAAGLQIYRCSGYLYAVLGISVCYVVGYLASWMFANESRSLKGLTLWD